MSSKLERFVLKYFYEQIWFKTARTTYWEKYIAGGTRRKTPCFGQVDFILGDGETRMHLRYADHPRRYFWYHNRLSARKRRILISIWKTVAKKWDGKKSRLTFLELLAGLEPATFCPPQKMIIAAFMEVLRFCRSFFGGPEILISRPYGSSPRNHKKRDGEKRTSHREQKIKFLELCFQAMTKTLG